jgi:hypothetical protein
VKKSIKGGFMMKKKLLLIFTILAVALGMLLANAGNNYAGDAEIVKIWATEEGDKKGMHADPATLKIKKNTIVVWMNGVQGKEVQVVFEDGKTCRDVTANPNLKTPGFFMDSRNCYVTSFLPYASTSTLQFPEAGGFDYSVMTSDGTMSSKGKIIVEQ